MANLIPHDNITLSGALTVYSHISGASTTTIEEIVQTPISANINIGSGQMFVTYNTMDKWW